MRKTLAVCLLALLLSSSVSAGIMPNGSPEPPPPPSSAQEPTDDATLDGEIHTTGDIQNDAPESLTQTALELLALLPSLL